MERLLLEERDKQFHREDDMLGSILALVGAIESGGRPLCRSGKGGKPLRQILPV